MTKKHLMGAVPLMVEERLVIQTLDDHELIAACKANPQNPENQASGMNSLWKTQKQVG